MAEFNRQVFIDNIYAIAKDKGILIRDLEKEGGVSVGYLSRLNQKDNKANPPADFVVSAANQLGVPFELLISQPYSQFTRTESVLFSFIKKLTTQTSLDLLVWKREAVESYGEVYFDCGETSHPLFSYDPAEPNPEIFYDSLFTRGCNPIDDGYVLRMTGSEVYYLMKVDDVVYGSSIELYLINMGHVKKVCFSGRVNRIFAEPLDQLYAVVTESCKHTKLEPDVLDSIQRYLDKAPGNQDVGKLPF